MVGSIPRWTQARYAQADACPDGPYGYGPGKVENPCDQFHFWSLHAGGSNFVSADGSVQFLKESTDLTTLERLAAMADGQVVNN